jgi:hypothetical protein
MPRSIPAGRKIMRKAVLAVLIGGALLTGGAHAKLAFECSTDTSAEVVPRNALYYSALYADDGTLISTERKCRWYAMDLLAGDLLGIYLGSNDFDSYLYVLGPDGEIVLESDDLSSPGGQGAFGLNSGGAFEARHDGEHLIIVTTYDSGGYGEFWLYLTTRQILAGRQINGRLDSDSLPLEADQLASLYLYRATAGERLDLSLSSPDFDTVLAVFAPSGEAWENDDAHGETTDSRLTIVAPEDGAYLIIVRAFFADEEGRYALRLVRR